MQSDAGVARPALPVAGAAAHDRRCSAPVPQAEQKALMRSAEALTDATALQDAAVQPAALRRMRRSVREWAQVAAAPQAPLVPAQQRPAAVLVRQALPERHDDGDELWMHPRLERLRPSPRARARESQLRDDDAQTPAARRHARASHVPSERECAQPGRHLAD